MICFSYISERMRIKRDEKRVEVLDTSVKTLNRRPGTRERLYILISRLLEIKFLNV